MAFVGRLVGGEAHIAVNAVGAVLYIEVRDRGVELRDAYQQGAHYIVVLGAHLVVPRTVGLKPLAGVVGGQLGKEMENAVHRCGFLMQR